MLSAHADYPYAGSTAYLAPDGQAVRVIRHNGDGTCLIALNGPRPLGEGASANRTIPLADLRPDYESAVAPMPKRRGRA